MEKQTRLKKFKGLPHELGGLDYTYDAEVEGKIGKDGKPAIGEYGYTPKGSKDEIILRENSRHKKQILKEEANRSKREKGDKISDDSFKEAVMPLFLEEFKDLAYEGIDPFNAGKDVFAIGGVNYYDDPEPEVGIPEIVDNNPKGSTGMSAGDATGYMASVGNLASSFGQFGQNDPYAEVTPQRDPVNQVTEQTVGSVVGAIPIVGQAYSGGQGLASLSESGIADMRAKDNDSGAQAAAFAKGFSSPSGSYFDLAEQNRIGAINDSQHASAIGLNLMIPGLGDALVGEPANKKFAESQQKQVGYNESLAERGKLPQSNEVVRNRTQQFGNGGMKKKYGDGGKNEFNPDDWSKFDKNFYEEPIDAETPYVPIMDNYVISQEDADNAYNYSLDKNATWNPPTTTNNSKKKFDPNMLTSIVGGLGQMVPSLAYLFGDGKDYDKVKYPTYNPAKVTADLPLRETRDAFESTRQVLKDKNKLDLGALSALATEESKGRSGVRENIANVNTGMMNDAQLKNIGFTIQAMNDEAANKGQYQTNKYEAAKDVAKVGALGVRQYNMPSNDEIRKQLIASMVDQKFEELYPS